MIKNNEPSKIIRDHNLIYEDLNDKDFTIILASLTGYVYDFAYGNSRIWGESGEVEEKPSGRDGFYQIMPHRDDGGFYHWYCYKRGNEQWFETKENCVLHFLFYRMKWIKLGSPSPY